MTRAITLVCLLSLLLIFTSGASPREQTPPHWLKGNLHTHSLWSDGNDFPEMIADWYKNNGYNFLALSDHNVLSVGERWLTIAESKRQNLDIAVKKYRERFPDVIEIRAGEKGEEIRLQPLERVRKLLEKPGQFMMVQSEEITCNFPTTGTDGTERKLPVHMNATNVAEAIPPATGQSVRDIIRKNFQAAEAQAQRLNRPIVTHLNHPNFGWGVTPEDLASVVEERYFEVYNGHPAVNTRGDATHPSTDKIWDICNTIRLAQMHAEPLFGLGSDDAHHYHTPGMNRSTPGRGWIMLRGKELSVDQIMTSLKAGDFYATSGVLLRDVKYDPASKTITIDIEPDGDATFTTSFVGTPKNFSDGGKTPLDSEMVGKTFASVTGTTATYKLTGEELYVRAVINSKKPPAVPSYENQHAQAWTQPVGWDKK